MPRRIVFTGKQTLEIEKFETEPLKDGELLIKNKFSLLSTGTETIVFNRFFEPGTGTDAWVKYPFYPCR